MANPGKNSVPLEKVLLQMDLGRGLDERTRPEVGGDQSKLVTGLNNLIQSQAGGWEKRHGLSNLASSSVDELGNSITLGRVVPTPDGVCFASTGVGLSKHLYHYHESSDSFRSKGNLPELGLKAYYVAASNAATRFASATPRILACASNQYYEAVVYEGGPTGTVVTGSAILVIYEKQSGSQVARYSIPPAGPVPIAATVPDIAIAFVGPVDVSETRHRYIHIYSHDQNLGTLQFASIDATATGTVWPATGTTITYTSLAPTPGNFIYDIGAAGNYSVVVLGTGGLYARDTSGNQFTRAGTWHSVSIPPGSTTAYFMGTDGGTSRTNILAVGISNIGAAGTTFVDPTLSPVAGSGGTNHLAVSSADIWWLAETSPAFGGTTLGTISVYYCAINSSSFTLVGTIRGWKVEGKPWSFGNGVGDRSYVHAVKDVSDRLRPHVVINLDDYLSLQRNTSAAATSTQHFKVSAVVEPYNGISSKQTAKCSRYKVYNSVEVAGFQTYQTVSAPISYGAVARAAAVGVYQLSNLHEDRFYSTRFGGEAIMGGGCVFAYDSCRPSELGIVDIPVTTISSVAAGALTGSYNYVTVYRHIDAASNASYSRVYGPVSKTYAGENGGVTIHACHVTSKETGVSGDHQVIVELYRTTNGGTQYHLLASSQYGYTNQIAFVGGANYHTFTDSVLDAALETGALLYRQPGTAGTALDRYPPPGGSVLCAHKDRVFVTDPYGINVYYSSFYVDGEMPWFNPQFFIRPHGGTGPITGLASMDGRLFIFKRDAIFVVDGDGPPENGGTGMEFSPPARLTTEYGCISPWSIVLTNNGIMYRSDRGIELLTRSLQVTWIGERVASTVDTYDVTVGAVQDSEGLVRFYLNDGYWGGTPIEVVYDTTNDSWCTATYAGMSQILGAGVYTDGRTPRVAISGGANTACYINTSSKLDNGSYYGWSFETGWVRPSGPQGRFRLYDVLILGKKRTDHKLKVSAAYDYGSYSQSRTWGPESLKETLEEVNFQPKKTQPVTFRVKVEEQAGGTLGTGEGVDLLGVCFVVSPKAGAQQVAEYKKG